MRIKEVFGTFEFSSMHENFWRVEKVDWRTKDDAQICWVQAETTQTTLTVETHPIASLIGVQHQKVGLIIKHYFQQATHSNRNTLDPIFHRFSEKVLEFIRKSDEQEIRNLGQKNFWSVTCHFQSQQGLHELNPEPHEVYLRAFQRRSFRFWKSLWEFKRVGDEKIV